MEDAGDAGASPRRASSSSSSGGGGLPVKRLSRVSNSSGSSPRREASPEDERLQRPQTGAAKIEASPQRDRGVSEKTSTSPSPKGPTRGRTNSQGKSRTPSPKKQASPRAEHQTPTGTPLSSTRGDGIRRANTQPLTTEEKHKARSVSPPPVYVRTGSPLAATKCSTERQKIGRARALAAGVKKQTVEQAKSQITGSFLLEQSQASKELSAKQRKEWMAAVKRTQDSSAKFVAQKRLAANNPSSVSSEAYERAQLIRLAQDDNWLDHLRAEDNVEVRSKTPPKAREKPPMPKSIASAIGPAGDKVVGEFKKMLLEKGGNFVRAWRYLLDPDCRGQLTLPQLAQRCRELGFQENVRTLWYALNGPDGDAAITMAEVDSESEEILMNFRAALLARALELGFPKKYHITEVPDLVASCMLRVLDLDRSHRLTRREFVCAVAIQKLASPAEAPILFEMLCHGQPGLCGHSHHSATAVVKVNAMKWLYLIAARAEDLPISEGKKDQEDQEADQKGLGKGREKGGIRTLRRVWTETPAVFKRLKEEQEKKVEEMLKLQKSLKQVETRPQISQPSYVHTVLYEDAKRRENARREASEPAVKAGRPHDQEYIERLAQKAPVKEAEEVPGPKRAVNLSRLTQLANERRLWHDQREKQRQAKIKEEAEICEQAAIQLREDVARKSRMTMALRHWRQLLAQVVIVAAFAPGLNAQGEEKGGVWQLLALAAGSSKAHLRLAEDHDDVLSIAGGASLSWKDRARITMAARLKLLVRFKQVEEHWGCALDELLEGMNPDVPRNLDKQPKSVQGLEPAAVALPAKLAAAQQCAPFEGADSFVRLESLRDAGPLDALPGPARPEPKPAKPRTNERHAHGTPPRRGLVQPSAVPQRPQQLAVFES